jgi:hypothetical protein
LEDVDQLSPFPSCSAARIEAPPPFETLEAMTSVLPGLIPPRTWAGRT